MGGFDVGILERKIFSAKEAVSRFIHDGDSIAMGTALETTIPFAIGREIIRQEKKDLTLVGPISMVSGQGVMYHSNPVTNSVLPMGNMRGL